MECQYNLSNISFLDDILEEIGITEDWRIEKPGKNSEKGEELNKLKDEAQYVYKGMALKTQDRKRMGKIAHQNRIKRNKKKVELILFEKEDSVKFSKENLQRINHGHKPSI